MSVRDEIIKRMFDSFWSGEYADGLPWDESDFEADKDECRKFVDENIISLIASRLPMVVEECPECKGNGGHFVPDYDDSSKPDIFEPCDKCRESDHPFAKSTGRTTHPMTLDEAVSLAIWAYELRPQWLARDENLRGKG